MMLRHRLKRDIYKHQRSHPSSSLVSATSTTTSIRSKQSSPTTRSHPLKQPQQPHNNTMHLLILIIPLLTSAALAQRYCRGGNNIPVRGCPASGNLARCCARSQGGVYTDFTDVTSLGTVDSSSNLSGTSSCDDGRGALVCLRQN